MYNAFKFLHILGVVVLIGNVTVTAVWKVFADRTCQAQTIAFAQRLVTLTDWSLTGAGIVLIVVGGYGMSLLADMPLMSVNWLVGGQALFILSGGIWLMVLVPIQSKQSRLARQFGAESVIPDTYWRLGRLWLWWGIAATVPLVGALAVMIVK
jgi:uncharacterized membrane protein